MGTRIQPRIVRREAAPGALDLLKDLPPLQQRVFAHRGVSDLDHLELSLAQLLPVDEFPACREAAALLGDVVQESGKILLVGDYDADGATGVVVATRCLRAMGHEAVDYLVPDRVRHGYGMCVSLMEEILERAPALIVTVDNGMSSQAAIAQARERGVRVLVTDHHLPGEELPPADCIVNPNSPDGCFPSSALAGVGTVFYVMVALRRHLQESGWFSETRSAPNMAQFLDLVALGTIADVVPLDRNNRILVENGLRCIRSGKGVPGIISLLRFGKRDPRRASSTDLAFAVAPRINAAGRIEDISIGIRCLLAEGRVEAHSLAQELDQINKRRRIQQEDMQTEAMQVLKEMELDPEGVATLCLYRPKWHEGLVGILAARIKEEYGLPTVVFADAQGGVLKGSGRSIEGLHMRDALVRVEREAPDLMVRYGGHAAAVGLTLHKEKLAEFESLFEAVVAEEFADGRPRVVLETDGELPGKELTLENAEFASTGHPWGKDFASPIFEGEFEVKKIDVFKNIHTRFQLAPVDCPDMEFKAMAFSHERLGWDAKEKPIGSRLRLVYELQLDEFQGHRSVMLNIQNIERL